MRGRRRNTSVQNTAPAGAGDALGLALANAILGNARGGKPGSDPVISFGTAAGNWQQSGSLAGVTVSTLASLLSEFNQGIFANVAPVWEAMERRDDAIAPAKAKRVRKVVREVRSWQVVELEDSAEARRQAEFLRRFWGRLRCRSAIVPAAVGGVAKYAEFALDAVMKQYSFMAKNWRGRGQDLSLELVHVPLWFFRLEQGVPRFVPAGGAVSGMEVLPEQWVVAAQHTAVMEAAAITCLFKRLPIHQLVHMLEKWGVPSVYGKTSAEKGSSGWTALHEALQNLVSGFSAITSGDCEIGTVEPKAGGMSGGGLHRAWVERCDESLTISILGGSLSTRAQGDTGNLAGGAQAVDMEDLIGGDCVWLSELGQEQIDRDALRYGLGVEEPLAAFQVRKADAQDDQGDMDLLERGVKLGARVSVGWLHERFGWPMAAAGEDLLALAPAGLGGLALNSAPAAAPCACAVRTANASATAARAVQSGLDGLVAASLPPLRKALAGLVQPLLDQAQFAPSPATLAADAASYTPPAGVVDEVAEQAARMVFAAAAIGRLPLPNRRGNAANAAVQYGPLPFEEAREFWRKKVDIADYDAWVDATWAQARVYGFKVARITEKTQIAALRGLVGEVVEGTRTIQEFVDAATQRYGLNSRHAEIVARTNVQTAYAWGHYQQLTDPAVTAELPIWAFETVDDERTSDICRPLTGRAYRHDDPIWDTLYPPNHYSCRTTVVAMTEEDARAQGFQIGGGWPANPDTGATFMPHPNFSMNVGKVPSLGDVLPDPATEAAGNADATPRHPAGAPASKGGEFAETGSAGGGKGDDAGFASAEEARQQFDRDFQNLLNPTRSAPPRENRESALSRLDDGLTATDSDGREIRFPSSREILAHWRKYTPKEIADRLASLNMAVAAIRTGPNYQIGPKTYYIGSFRDRSSGNSAIAEIVIAYHGKAKTFWAQRADYVKRTDIRDSDQGGNGEWPARLPPVSGALDGCAGGGTVEGRGLLRLDQADRRMNADTYDDSTDDEFVQYVLAKFAEVWGDEQAGIEEQQR
jgi:SPP1 gp7 family putative phage head morphogenesis protein